MDAIVIETDFIKIGQFLKLINKILSGGEAKYFLIQNDVYINEKRCFERNKKLFKGDIVQIFNEKYIIK